MITDRLRRAIRLLELLCDQDHVSIDQLVHVLSCSRRTVYRDLQLLRECGFEIVAPPDGYRLGEGATLPKASLSGQELSALMSTLNASPLMRNVSTRWHVQQALQKLSTSVSSQTREQWRRFVRLLTDHHAEAGCDDRLMGTIRELALAMSLRSVIRLGAPHDPNEPCKCKEFLLEKMSATPEGWSLTARDIAANRTITLELALIDVCRRPSRMANSTTVAQRIARGHKHGARASLFVRK